MIRGLAHIAAGVRSGQVSAASLMETVLQRIAADQLNAWVYVDPEGARQAAREVDERVAAGADPGQLAGIPFGVKDLDDAAGMPTRHGSRWYQDAPPATGDDLHVARLRLAGAIPVGKTATPQFGSAAYTASPVHGVTGNPWAPTQTPGGSSGGSAAAVAAGMVPFCTASDGGGSIRGPASLTGLPGLRPSYGRVPSFGSTHLAQNAVNFALAPTVDDTALLLDICAGPDPRDRTCLPGSDTSFARAARELEVAGLRVAHTASYGIGPVDPEVANLVEAGCASLVRHAGLVSIDIDTTLPFFYETYSKIDGVDRWIDITDDLWPARAAELGDLEAGWSSGARARLPQLGRVYADRRRIEHTVAGWFDHVDIVITPTLGIPAFGAAGPHPTTIAGEEVHPFVGLLQPILPSLCNLPAMTVPVGLTAAGLPVGMQVIAGQHREDRCLRLARVWEESTTWPRLPQLEQGFLDNGG